MRPDETKIITTVYDKGRPAFIVRTFERDSSAVVSPPPRFHVTAVKRVSDGEQVWEEGDGPLIQQHFKGVETAYMMLRKEIDVST